MAPGLSLLCSICSGWGLRHHECASPSTTEMDRHISPLWRLGVGSDSVEAQRWPYPPVLSHSGEKAQSDHQALPFLQRALILLRLLAPPTQLLTSPPPNTISLGGEHRRAVCNRRPDSLFCFGSDHVVRAFQNVPQVWIFSPEGITFFSFVSCSTACRRAKNAV